MVYQYTQYNLVSLMQQLGTLKREQLIQFFSDEMTPNRIKYLLDKLVINHYLNYDPVKDRYSYHAAPKEKEEVVSRRIQAFYVPANMGSVEIMTIELLPYPLCLSFIGADNTCYDVSYITSVSEATFVKRHIEASIPKDTTDNVNHIAVVPTAVIGEKLKPYGFDCYGIVNHNDGSINYVSFET